eukprot:8446258-Karenia_brevis.AAC.1
MVEVVVERFEVADMPRVVVEMAVLVGHHDYCLLRPGLASQKKFKTYTTSFLPSQLLVSQKNVMKCRGYYPMVETA